MAVAYDINVVIKRLDTKIDYVGKTSRFAEIHFDSFRWGAPQAPHVREI
jgi:hypothetical protein